MSSAVDHEGGLSLPEVLRHCADLADELGSGRLSSEGERSRLSYLLVTLSEARAHVEMMWQLPRQREERT